MSQGPQAGDTGDGSEAAMLVPDWNAEERLVKSLERPG